MIEPDPGKLADFLPDTLTGWQAGKTTELKVPTDLYNYIDGGAELYLSYGFNQALSRTYIKAGKQDVLAEVYDLVEPRNAFGVFTQTREEDHQEFGQGTYRIPGAVFFWKSHYYITLSAWESSPESNEFINELAAYIDAKIQDTGDIPALIKLLPQEGMVPWGFKYFHHYVWLNSFFFISDHNLLQIDEKTDAVLARYAEGDQRKYLLLVQYADPAAAGQAYASFGKEFFPEGLVENCIRLEDNTWMAAALRGNFVIAVFNALSKQSAGQLLSGVITKIQ